MDIDKVLKLVELMETHGLAEVEVEEGDFHVRLKKGSSEPPPAPIAAPPIAPVHVAAPINGVPVQAQAPVQPASPADAPAEEGKDTVEITSLMVGTFYRSSTPDADPFVHEGDHLMPDSVICIIEAMKVMNEIKAEIEGELVSILVENGESVEYGQPIMLVRPPNPAS